MNIEKIIGLADCFPFRATKKPSLAWPTLPHYRKGLVTLALQICTAGMRLCNEITTIARQTAEQSKVSVTIH